MEKRKWNQKNFGPIIALKSMQTDERFYLTFHHSEKQTWLYELLISERVLEN
jgi:hypothetical protein